MIPIFVLSFLIVLLTRRRIYRFIFEEFPSLLISIIVVFIVFIILLPYVCICHEFFPKLPKPVNKHVQEQHSAASHNQQTSECKQGLERIPSLV